MKRAEQYHRERSNWETQAQAVSSGTLLWGGRRAGGGAAKGHVMTCGRKDGGVGGLGGRLGPGVSSGVAGMPPWPCPLLQLAAVPARPLAHVRHSHLTSNTRVAIGMVQAAREAARLEASRTTGTGAKRNQGSESYNIISLNYNNSSGGQQLAAKVGGRPQEGGGQACGTRGCGAAGATAWRVAPWVGAVGDRGGIGGAAGSWGVRPQDSYGIARSPTGSAEKRDQCTAWPHFYRRTAAPYSASTRIGMCTRARAPPRGRHRRKRQAVMQSVGAMLQWFLV